MTTDAQAALAQVREALSAGPTPGPWYVRTNRHPTTSGRSWGWLDAAPPGGPQRAIAGVRVEWEGGDTSAVNARYLAACSPANIAAILAHVDAQAAEIERLRKFAGRALGEARQFMSDVDGGDVQAWAVECGLLEEWTPTEPCGEQCECAEVADFPTQCYRLTEMGRAAIDAAMGGGDAG